MNQTEKVFRAYAALTHEQQMEFKGWLFGYEFDRTEPAVATRRGRPKGSRNKPKEETAATPRDIAYAESLATKFSGGDGAFA